MNDFLFFYGAFTTSFNPLSSPMGVCINIITIFHIRKPRTRGFYFRMKPTLRMAEWKDGRDLNLDIL